MQARKLQEATVQVQAQELKGVTEANPWVQKHILLKYISTSQLNRTVNYSNRTSIIIIFEKARLEIAVSTTERWLDMKYLILSEIFSLVLYLTLYNH